MSLWIFLEPLALFVINLRVSPGQTRKIMFYYNKYYVHNLISPQLR